jgi:hypothetical protein
MVNIEPLIPFVQRMNISLGKDLHYQQRSVHRFDERNPGVIFTRFVCGQSETDWPSVNLGRWRNVGRMQAASYLDSAPDRRLQPGPKFFNRPHVDVIVDGTTEPAFNLYASPDMIDRHLVRIPSRTVLFTVKGDSMIEAGLLEGDWSSSKKGRRPGGRRRHRACGWRVHRQVLELE